MDNQGTGDPHLSTIPIIQTTISMNEACHGGNTQIADNAKISLSLNVLSTRNPGLHTSGAIQISSYR